MTTSTNTNTNTKAVTQLPTIPTFNSIEGKVVSEWIHPKAKVSKTKEGSNECNNPKPTQRTWKQRLRFTTYCKAWAIKFYDEKCSKLEFALDTNY